MYILKLINLLLYKKEGIKKDNNNLNLVLKFKFSIAIGKFCIPNKYIIIIKITI